MIEKYDYIYNKIVIIKLFKIRGNCFYGEENLKIIF